MNEALFQILGKLIVYGGGSVAIAYGLFVFLGKKWIENEFAAKLEEYKTAQNKELEGFKYKISTLFNRAKNIHEKEYDVLPSAWAKLHDAKDNISSLLSPLQSYPDFSRLTEVEIRRVLKGYHWEDHQIDSLNNAHDKNQFFQEIVFWQRLQEAQAKFSEFHIYIVRNRIFLSSELKEHFSKADDLMWDALITRKVGEESKDHKMNYDAYKKLKENIDEIITAIEKLVQERLRSNEDF